MRSSTGMFEVALFLAILGVCLTVAFTSYHYAERGVGEMSYKTDVRQIQQVATGGITHNYMNRQGAYLDAMRLAFSVGTVSADSRATINLLGTTLEVYDMYVMNAGEVTSVAPAIYEKIETWWNGFKASPEYNCVRGNSCPGPLLCSGNGDGGTAFENTYNFSDSGTHVRTFDPSHITPDVAGYEMPNPKTLDDAKFKMRLVENGKDAEGNAILEYRLYIFLGSLTKDTLNGTPKIEYRWYECVMGNVVYPWVVLE
mgnify:FL=1